MIHWLVGYPLPGRCLHLVTLAAASGPNHLVFGHLLGGFCEKGGGQTAGACAPDQGKPTTGY